MTKGRVAGGVALLAGLGGTVAWLAGVATEELPGRPAGVPPRAAAAAPEDPPESAQPPTRGRRLREPQKAQEDAVTAADELFEWVEQARRDLARRQAGAERRPRPAAPARLGIRFRTPDGPVLERYPDGAKKREGTLVDGKREGLWIDHHPDGSRTEIEYRAGEKHGQEAGWRPGGTSKFLGTWRDGKMSGAWTAWHENGVISTTREYRDGKLHGRMQTFHENGVLESESTFAGGADVATAFGWHDNGTLAWVMPYVEGKRQGQATWYDRDGRLASEGTYVGGGLDGVWTKYAADGTVERTERWRKGVALGGR